MKLGFDLLLWTTHVTEQLWPILDDLKDVGLAATGIGVMSGGSAISPDKAVRAAALDHLKWLVDCTAAIGGDVVAGPFHQPLGEFSGKGPTADEVAWCADVHKQAAQY